MKINELKTIDELYPSLDRDAYVQWWDAAGVETDDALIRTLARHVIALQDRLDSLPSDLRCGCAYDHPDDLCMVHKPGMSDAGGSS